MKKLLAIILSLVMVMSFLPSLSLTALAADDLQDTVTGVTLTDSDGDGYYEISSADELVAFANLVNTDYNDINIELTKDIDMTDKKWSTIIYAGTIEGAGHTISNLEMIPTDIGLYVAGFMYSVGAEVRNITFDSCTAIISTEYDELSSDFYVGIIAAASEEGLTLTNCSAVNCIVEQNALADGQFSYAGGLLGAANAPLDFDNCSFQGGYVSSVNNSHPSYVGGLVGGVWDFGDGLEITNSFCSGDLVGKGTGYIAVGGLVGLDQQEEGDLVHIYENCYFSGDITSDNMAAGLISDCCTKATVTNCAVLSESISALYGDPFIYGEAAVVEYSDITIGEYTESVNQGSTGHEDWVSGQTGTAITKDAAAAYQIAGFKSNLYGALADASENVTITLSQNEAVKYTAVTDVDGEYNFGKQVLPGTYTLSIAADAGYEAYEASVTVNYATNEELDITREAVEVTATWATIGAAAVEGTDYAVDASGNYTVYTAAGLAKIANIVNGGDSLEGKTVTLNNDIDLLQANLTGYGADTVTETTSWIPITGFLGTFDGNSKKIENLYVVTVDTNAGLFGTNSGTIKNLEIASGKISGEIKSTDGEVSLGTIAAVNAGIIENCVNRASVELKSSSTTSVATVYVGGIVGLTNTALNDLDISKVVNCTNYGDVTSASGSGLGVYGGGIAGYSYGGRINNQGTLIESCTNNGNVSITGCRTARAGGITGYAYSVANIGTTIQQCANNGDVTGNGSYCMTGGIVGYNYTRSYIYDCYNTGDVTGIKNVGGISGYSRATVDSCYNIGTVTTTDTSAQIGGVIGNKNGGTVTNCYYLDDNATVLGGIKGADVADSAEVKTTAEFNSGEVTYFLNEGVADGSQVWYQNIGTDDYPVFDGDTVSYNETEDAYYNVKIYSLDWSGPCDVVNKPELEVGYLFPEDAEITSYSIDITNIISGCAVTYMQTDASATKIEFTTVVKEEPATGKFAVIFHTTNYGDITVVINITLTGQYIVNISGLTAMDSLYNGEVNYGYTGAPVGTLTSGAKYSGGWNVVYTDSEGTVLDSAPTEVGSYTVTFSVSDTENYKGSASYKFSIIEEAEAVYQAEENGEWINAAFTEAVAKVYEGGTVKLLKNINVESTTVIGKNVTITSNDAENPVSITTEVDAHKYLLNITADVVMENIIVDGGSANGITATRALIEVNSSGKLTLNEGAIVRNNNNTTTNGAGGGVCVKLGDLVINGGSVTGNKAYSGGGVAVMAASCKVTLSDGEISNNTATRTANGGGGGVYVADGTFTMTGGSIKDNTATKYGGGFYSYNSATAIFNLEGGSITGNSATTGGGIFINSVAKLNVSGGSVTANSATNFAGGVECSPFSVITITGNPVISGNTSGEETNGGFYPDGHASYGYPSIYVGALTEGADVNFYTWLEADGFKVASPVENYTITDSDMAKMSYESSTYYLKLDESGNVVLATGVNVTVDGESVTTDGYIVLGIDNGDGTYSLPANVVGYYMNDDFVDAGKYAVVGGEVINTVGFNVTMVNGAQVRYGGGLDENGKVKAGNGLRFLAEVDRSNFDATAYGMRITAEGSSAETIVAAEKWQNDTTFSVAITDMAESNYIRKFTATPYVVVTYDDGTEKTIYGTDTVTRSIYQVAAGLLKDETQLGYGLSDVLNAYANQSGIRLVVKDGELKANTSYTAKGAYELTENELHFAVSDAAYDAAGNKYSVILTAVGNAEIITDNNYWYEYIRINNNNSLIKDKVTVEKVEDNDKAVKVTFAADGLIERPSDSNDNTTPDDNDDGFDGETEGFN
ncbi:MAG: carboxypeptidase regulatory-like domain-containing protein [Clostridia bacterium]|nr:carboxypeptidase regulatory-like domain-containing protein [Clostridia bacterium]